MNGDLDPPSQCIVIDGLRYAFRKTGQGHGMVLLHGLSETSRVFWRELILHFKSQFTIVALDLLGYGDSDRPQRGYEPSAQAQAIREITKQLQLERPVIVGHSLGGIIGAKYAVLFPDQLQSLVLYDSPLGGALLDHLSMAKNLPFGGVALLTAPHVPIAGKFLFQLRTPAIMRSVARYLCLTADPSSYTEEMIQEGMRNSHDAVTQWMWNALRDDVHDRVDQILVPTLIIRGEFDAIVPQEWVERINARIPNSRLVTIKNAGHTALNEQPHDFLQALSEFLATIQRGDVTT